MGIRPQCYPCLERLVELTLDLATADPEVRRQARRTARQIITREFSPGAIPAAIANRFHRAIQKITGNEDPFLFRKAEETAVLAEMWRRVSLLYPEDLVSLLKLAAAGNAVDFFRSQTEVTQEMQSLVEFGISEAESLQRKLDLTPGLLLYLADNAGEQFFDLALVAYLRRLGWQVLYVVKGGPIQNDLTLQDLVASGMAEALAPVIDTGLRTVGLDLDEVTSTFRQLYESAHIIVAKGMGHFETMSHLADGRLFFLLQAKCTPVAQALGVRKGTFVFTRVPPLPWRTTEN